jgi:catechol 2,3-dioxygenase-like lactoylglutathione lyase family enzyme
MQGLSPEAAVIVTTVRATLALQTDRFLGGIASYFIGAAKDRQDVPHRFALILCRPVSEWRETVARIRYFVDDVEKSVAFYTGKLGFSLQQQFGPAMAILNHDDIELWLAGPPASASRPMPDGSQPVPGGWNRFVLMVRDIENMTAKLRADGVAFRNDIVTGPGGRQILCADPSGNVIELFQPA